MSYEEADDEAYAGALPDFAVLSALDGDALESEPAANGKPPLAPFRGGSGASPPKSAASRLPATPSGPLVRGRSALPASSEEAGTRRQPGSRSASQDASYENGSGNMTPAKGGGAATSRVSVRLGQPVQGCEVEPYILARDHTGSILSKDDPRIRARWLRSASFTPCANPRCAKAAVDTAHTLQPTLQCLTCLRLSLPAGSSFFCSPACLKSGWVLHRAYHHDPAAGSDPACTVPLHAMDQFPWKSFEFVNRFRGAPGRVAEDAWATVAEGLLYVPSRGDVGHKLRLEVLLDDDGTGFASPTVEAASTRWTLPHPPPCPSRKFVFVPNRAGVVPARGDGFSGDRSQAHSVRIMTYNVLAEIFATQSQYPYCPLWALRWTYRRALLLAELRSRDADIICLQEVQADHFENFFHPELAKLGYEGLYKQKTREAMGVEGKVDGCAMFFRKARFNLMEKYVIEFNDAALAESQKLKASQAGASGRKHELSAALHRLLRDNVAQVVLLELVRDPAGNLLPVPQPLCIANTHLFWDPEYADVKLWQTHMLVKELEKFTLQRTRVLQHSLPLMLCGDFNSPQGSAVYKLLCGNVAAGALRSALQSEDLPADPCSILPSRGKLSHQLYLSSAYAVVTGAEPTYTNFTGDFTGCLDYLWYTSDSMRVVSALEIPTEDTITGYSGSALPNQQYPSDHISLCFDVVLGQPQNNIPEPVAPVPASATAAVAAPSGGGDAGYGLPASAAHMQHQLQHQQQQAARAMMQTMAQQQSYSGRGGPVMAASRLGAGSMPYIPRSSSDNTGAPAPGRYGV